MQPPPPFCIICPEPLDRQWLLSLPAGLLSDLLCVLNDRDLANMIPSAAFDALEAFVTTGAEKPLSAMEYYFSRLLLRGRIQDAGRVLHESGLDRHSELEGWLAVLQGDDDAAIRLFDQGIARLKKADLLELLRDAGEIGEDYLTTTSGGFTST